MLSLWINFADTDTIRNPITFLFMLPSSQNFIRSSCLAAISGATGLGLMIYLSRSELNSTSDYDPPIACLLLIVPAICAKKSSFAWWIMPLLFSLPFLWQNWVLRDLQPSGLPKFRWLMLLAAFVATYFETHLAALRKSYQTWEQRNPPTLSRRFVLRMPPLKLVVVSFLTLLPLAFSPMGFMILHLEVIWYYGFPRAAIFSSGIPISHDMTVWWPEIRLNCVVLLGVALLVGKVITKLSRRSALLLFLGIYLLSICIFPSRYTYLYEYLQQVGLNRTEGNWLPPSVVERWKEPSKARTSDLPHQ